MYKAPTAKKKGLSGGAIAAIVVTILIIAGVGIVLGITLSGSDSKSGSSSRRPGGTSHKVSHTTKAPGTSTPVSTKAPGTTINRSTQPAPSTTTKPGGCTPDGVDTYRTGCKECCAGSIPCLKNWNGDGVTYNFICQTEEECKTKSGQICTNTCSSKLLPCGQ